MHGLSTRHRCHSDVLVEEVKGLEEERCAKEARRARRAAEAFSAMLRHHKTLEADTTWEQAQSMLSGEPEWDEVADEAEKKALFDEAVARLQAREKERSKRKVGRWWCVVGAVYHYNYCGYVSLCGMDTEGRE